VTARALAGVPVSYPRHVVCSQNRRLVSQAVGRLFSRPSHGVGFRNSVRVRRAASARRSVASRFPASEVVRGLVVRPSGPVPTVPADGAAVQVGALEGARDPVAAARAGDPAPAAAARTGSTRRSGASGGARPGAAAQRLDRLVGTPGDTVALASAAGQAALDLSKQTFRAAAARSSGTGARRSTRTGEPVVGLPTDRW
jgi:hypothetical protein